MRLIHKSSELPEVLDIFKKDKTLSWDTETSPSEVSFTLDDKGEKTYSKEDQEINKKRGLDPYRNRLRLLQIANREETVVICCDEVDVKDLKILQPLLDNAKTIGVNLSFDAKQLLFHSHLHMKDMWDLGLAELLLTAGMTVSTNEWFRKSSLVSLMQVYTGKVLTKEVRDEFAYGLSITDEQIAYAASDVSDLCLVYDKQIRNIYDANLYDAALVEMGAILGDVEMELTGLHVNRDKWMALANDAAERREAIYEEMQSLLLPPSYKELFGDLAKHIKVVDVNSPLDLQKSLLRVGLEIPNTAEQTLQDQIHNLEEPFHVELLEKVLDYREASKQATTYGEEWWNKYISPVTGKVHTHYRGIGAVTARVSSSDPNMQQIPSRGENGAKYRKCFEVPSGSNLAIVTADCASAELRLLAWFSQDPNMMAAFNGEHELDIHSNTACLMFGYEYEDFLKKLASGNQTYKDQRSIGKTVNFGIVNGMGAAKGASQTGLSKEAFYKHMQTWKQKAYPVAWKWLMDTGIAARRDLQVRGIAGHRRFFVKPDQKEMDNKEYNWALGRIEREGKNFPIQNGNAVWLKTAKKLAPSRLHVYEARLCHQVHDELVAICHEMVAEEVAQTILDTLIEAGNIWMCNKGKRKAVKAGAEVKISTAWSK